MKTLHISFAVILLVFISVSCDRDTKKRLVGITFNTETLRRVGNDGDNWCTTWAIDDAQVTSMCDGNWLAVGKFNHKTEAFHNQLYKIIGGPDDFEKVYMYEYPDFRGNYDGWFGYGIIAVDSNIYSMVSKSIDSLWTPPFPGVKMLKSPDNGKKWYRVNSKGEEKLLETFDSKMRDDTLKDEMFFFRESGRERNGMVGYPFSYCSFVQCGKANSEAKDDYIYIYAPEFSQSNQLLLARVNKREIEQRDHWEFFKSWEGEVPVWTKDLKDRGVVHQFPVKNDSSEYFGWYSWLPSVVWNKGLGVYIMANGGTRAYFEVNHADTTVMYYDNWAHKKTGSLGFWWSKNPYGPWKQFYYIDYFTVDHANNRTYQPKLSPKWISEDGTKMVLIWSDAGMNDQGEYYSDNYLWNQMEITLELN